MKDEDVKTLLQEMEWVRKHHTTDCWLAQAEKLRKRNLRMALFNHFLSGFGQLAPSSLSPPLHF